MILAGWAAVDTIVGLPTAGDAAPSSSFTASDALFLGLNFSKDRAIMLTASHLSASAYLQKEMKPELQVKCIISTDIHSTTRGPRWAYIAHLG